MIDKKSHNVLLRREPDQRHVDQDVTRKVEGTSHTIRENLLVSGSCCCRAIACRSTNRGIPVERMWHKCLRRLFRTVQIAARKSGAADVQLSCHTYGNRHLPTVKNVDFHIVQCASDLYFAIQGINAT